MKQNMSPSKRFLKHAILAFLGSAPCIVSAEGASDSASESSPVGFSNGSVIVAPIPFSNPLFGSGLALGGAYLFKADEKSDTSNIGLGGFSSTSGSQALGASFKYAWDSNRWTIGATIAEANLNYDVYTPVGAIPINQTGTYASLTLRYEFSNDISISGFTNYLQTTVGLDSDKIGFPPGIELNTDMAFANIGAEVKRDTTNNDYYPTSGTRFAINGKVGKELTNSNRSNFNKGEIYLTGYAGLAKKTVVSGKVYQCYADRGTPFFDLCAIGAGDGFRGYSPTQYLGTSSTSAQVEIRQRISDRFGVVAFAGVGTGDVTYEGNIGTKYAGGAGLRFRLSRKFPLDFSADVAVNDEYDRTYYVYVGQRF